MGTLDRPQGVTGHLTGLDLSSLSDAEVAAVRANRIGFVFQQFFMDEHISALDNVANGLLYAGVPLAERRRRAAEALARVGLADRADFLPTRMSGGQRQRVAIARALIGRPAVVLADEPTGNLDTVSGAAILDLLRELNDQGTTIVVITHDRELASRLPRQVEVRDGRIVSDSQPKLVAWTEGAMDGSGADAAKGEGVVPSPAAGRRRRLARRATGSRAPAPRLRRPSGPRPQPTRLSLADLVRLAAAGLRARKQRAALSAVGIAIGVGATVAVLGLSASAQAGLLAEIARLGTNLLTVQNGTNFLGQSTELPIASSEMIARLPGVTAVAATGDTSADAYRSPLIPSGETGGLTVAATSTNLPQVVGTTIVQGSFLNAATAIEPVAVLGSAAASQLGIDRLFPGERLWVGGAWFYVAGILAPAPLATEINTSVLVGFPAADTYFGFNHHPTELYVRAQIGAVTAVDNLLGNQANPEDPSGVTVSQPSSALVAQADAQGAFTGLFVALAAVALFVGAIGVANIMVTSVLERRREIGLQRAMGATRGQVRVQFLSEAMLLGGVGGVAGIVLGAAATVVYALPRGWLVVVPPLAWGGEMAAALAIGAIAGLIPAQRAAALAPTEALRTM